MRYVNSVIHDFESKEHDLTIPSYLFDDFESKPIILISDLVTKTRNYQNNC